jgi:hypothetical protein
VGAGTILDGISFDDLPRGFYFVRINLGDLGTETVKIVKE